MTKTVIKRFRASGSKVPLHVPNFWVRHDPLISYAYAHALSSMWMMLSFFQIAILHCMACFISPVVLYIITFFCYFLFKCELCCQIIIIIHLYWQVKQLLILSPFLCYCVMTTTMSLSLPFIFKIITNKCYPLPGCCCCCCVYYYYSYYCYCYWCCFCCCVYYYYYYNSWAET